MDEKKKNYISSVIHDINEIIKKCEKFDDSSFSNYVIDLIHNNLNERIETHIKGKYEEKITTYLQNYLNAKIKNLKQK